MGKIAEGIKSIISGIGRFFKGLFKKEAEVKNVTLLSGKNDNSNEDKDRSILGSIWDSLWDFVWELIGYLGWYKRAESPSNPGKQETLDSVINYEIINYINDVSLENAEVLMTSDMKGNYTSAYTYGLDRISVDNLKVVNNIKTDPLYYLYDGRGSVTELVNGDGQVTGKNDYEAFGITDHVGYLGNVGIHYENYYGYNGENYNERSGLQYLRARYYEPETGTFLTRDSYLGNIMNPLSQNRYSYAENNPIMNVDPSGHIAKWIKNLGSAIKSTVTNVVSSVKSFATKAVEVIEKLPSSVKQVFTGTGSQVKKNSNTSKATTSSKTYSYTETQAFRTTVSESRFNLAKTSTKNTAVTVKQQAKPVISTGNYPLQVLRDNMESIQAACEGTEAVSNQSYDYKDKIIDVVLKVGKHKVKEAINDGINLVVGFSHGVSESLSFGFSGAVVNNIYENNDKNYFTGKILGNLLSGSVAGVLTAGSTGAAVATSPTGVGTVTFSAAATYTGAVAVSASGHFVANVISLSEANGSGGGYSNNGKGREGVEKSIDVNKVIDSATQAKKGGETVIGHALQKHAGRNPDIWGKVKGGPGEINETALKHLNDILNGTGEFKVFTTDKGVQFLEKMLQDGRGVRLNMDGTFKGFIDQIR